MNTDSGPQGCQISEGLAALANTKSAKREYLASLGYSCGNSHQSNNQFGSLRSVESPKAATTPTQHQGGKARQLRLPFTPRKETQAERCRRLLSGVPKLTTAARKFDDTAFREATNRASHAELG